MYNSKNPFDSFKSAYKQKKLFLPLLNFLLRRSHNELPKKQMTIRMFRSYPSHRRDAPCEATIFFHRGRHTIHHVSQICISLSVLKGSGKCDGRHRVRLIPFQRIIDFIMHISNREKQRTAGTMMRCAAAVNGPKKNCGTARSRWSISGDLEVWGLLY